jgi:hypothetical protein
MYVGGRPSRRSVVDDFAYSGGESARLALWLCKKSAGGEGGGVKVYLLRMSQVRLVGG